MNISNNATLSLAPAQFATATSSADLGANRTVVIGAGGATVNVTSYSDAYTTATPNTLTISGPITGTVPTDTFTKTGTGTLVVSNGANTYAEKTQVSAGTVVVSGSISGTASVNVGDGTNPATLAGTGTIATANGGTVTVNNAAFLAPGLSAAGLTINAQNSGTSAMNLAAGSTLQLSISNSQAATPGAPLTTDYSKLTLGTGVSATIAGILATTETGAINGGDVFTIILNQAGNPQVAGLFSNTGANIANSTYAYTDASGQRYEINYAYSGPTTNFNQDPTAFANITGGNNVALLAVVPEPNSLGMLVASLGMALGLQRFRRRRFEV